MGCFPAHACLGYGLVRCTLTYMGLSGVAVRGEYENVGQLSAESAENFVPTINMCVILSWLIPKPFTPVWIESLICT